MFALRERLGEIGDADEVRLPQRLKKGYSQCV
jgi:hypothetical protein